jgi:hypothetical protein
MSSSCLSRASRLSIWHQLWLVLHVMWYDAEGLAETLNDRGHDMEFGDDHDL